MIWTLILILYSDPNVQDPDAAPLSKAFRRAPPHKSFRLVI
jgi:hypothetical protein